MTDWGLPAAWLEESARHFEIATSYDNQGDEMYLESEAPGRSEADAEALRISARTLWGHASEIRQNIREQKDGFNTR